MSAKIIPFPRQMPAERPKFWEWLPDRVGATGRRKVYCVKRRTPTFKGVPWGEGSVLLLPREWEALEREYEAKYGPIYAD